MDDDIYQELLRLAKAQRLATYEEIVPFAGLDPAKPSGWAPLWPILCDISRSEHGERRPMLSAIIVSKRRNLPGLGFFTLARDLGVHKVDDDRNFWLDQVKKVHAEWLVATV